MEPVHDDGVDLQVHADRQTVVDHRGDVGEAVGDPLGLDDRGGDQVGIGLGSAAGKVGDDVALEPVELLLDHLVGAGAVRHPGGDLVDGEPLGDHEAHRRAIRRALEDVDDLAGLHRRVDPVAAGVEMHTAQPGVGGEPERALDHPLALQGVGELGEALTGTDRDHHRAPGTGGLQLDAAEEQRGPGGGDQHHHHPDEGEDDPQAARLTPSHGEGLRGCASR
jgi:hypothetical protein